MQEFIGFVAICLMVGFIKFCLQGSKRYFCVGCESIIRGVHKSRPFWGLLLGPLFLVLTPKLTCRKCKSHDVIPAHSPKAKRMLGAQVV